MQRPIHYYRKLADIFLALAAVVLVLNAVSYLFLLSRHETGGPLSKYDMSKLAEVYPDLSESDVIDLLASTWAIPFVYEPFTVFREDGFKSRFVNVSEHGYRVTSGTEPWPLRSNHCNVFILGGSTTFCYGLPDNRTIAFYLQKLLGDTKSSKPCVVYNFGRGHYYSTQETVLFQCLLARGVRPDLALFVDGFNDFVYTSGDPAFTKELAELIREERSSTWFPFRLTRLSPLGRAWNFLAHRVHAESPRKDGPIEKLESVQKAEAVVSRYMRNKIIVEALAEKHGVRTAFIWQPVPDYNYDLKFHLFYRGSGEPPNPVRFEGYRLMNDLRKANALGTNFIWCADIQEGLRDPLYCDAYHYSSTMSRHFADAVYEGLVKQQLLTKSPPGP